jgi:hypothetical protein
MAENVPDFTGKVYPLLEKAGCQSCHNSNGVASGTRLHFPESKEYAAVFGDALVALVDRSRPEESLLLKKPSLRVPHAGGKRIAPDSAEERAVLEWIRHLATFSDKQAQAARKAWEQAAGRTEEIPVLRRLTHSQYDHTVLDLLGDATSPAKSFPPEDFVHGFKTQFEAQSIPALLAEAYGAAAEKLARNAFRGGDTRKLIPCAPSGPADAACRDKFVRQFGRSAFRRPLTTPEIERYTALFVREAGAARDFLRGAQIVVEAVLQSPAFLFHRDSTDPHDMASRLSYFLWDSMPDDELLAAAATGELNSTAGIDRAARRMLKDEKARRSVDEFVSQWLRLDRMSGMVRDRRQFPLFTPELTVAMAEETRRLVHHLVWSGESFMRVFDADYTFLNSDLAAVYKLPAPAGEFEPVVLPPESGRAGIVGHGTFLALTSKPGETSPTARGLFVREQFLCQTVPPPPPGVNSNLPPLTEAKPQTNRERLAEHTTNESCAGCHKLIDPIGFGLEKFDAIGARREKLRLVFLADRKDRRTPPKSMDIDLDSSGSIAGIPDSAFSSPRELGRVLASSVVCQECIVKQVFRYATGRHETAADQPAIKRSLEDFRNSGFRFQDLMIAVLKYSQPEASKPAMRAQPATGRPQSGRT